MNKFLFYMLLFVSLGSNAQLLQWNTVGNLGTETTEPSIFNNANISATNLTLGAGVTPAANGNRFGGNNWFNTGNPSPSTLANAIAGNDYIQFIVTPNVGFSFTPTAFTFIWDRSATGPNSVTLRSSADGFTSDLGTLTALPTPNQTVFSTINISGLSNLTTATTFRLYGYGGTATGGTAGFDNLAGGPVNVQLLGTTASLTPPPTAVLTSPGIYCNGDTTNIHVSASGGTAPYTFSLNGGIAQADSNFYGLLAGTYTVQVTDAASSSTTVSISITQPLAITTTINSNSPLCNGDSTGSFTAIASGGTKYTIAPFSYIYDWYYNNVLIVNDSFANNLAAGTYMLVVEDSLGCIDTFMNLTLTEPTALNITASSSGNTISAVAGGGVSPYRYSIDGTSFQSSSAFNAVPNGTYTVTLKDTNNCITTTTVVVSGPVLSLSLSDNKIYCNGDTTQIVASASNGTAPYTYVINGGAAQTDSVFYGLSAGTYTILVSDAGSNTMSATYTITQPSALSLNLTSNNVLCNGGTSGSFVAVASGATPFASGTYNYVYDWYFNNVLIVNDSFANNLAAGTYMLVIEDSVGCIDTFMNLTLTEPSALVVNATASGTTINASGTGGVSPYQFSLNGITFQPSGTFAGNPVGTYTVTIKDSNNCTSTTTVAVTQILTITATDNTIYCNGGTTDVQVSVVGGPSPYTYSIDGSAFQVDSFFTNIAAGTHTIAVTDANSIVDSIFYTITQPSAISITLNASMPLCNGDSNGSITTTISGGTPFVTPPYVVDWYLNGTLIINDSNAINIGAGTYMLVVEDSLGCIDTINNISITEPSALSLTSSVSGYTINNLASGGTAPYQYSIDGTTFQSSSTFTNVAVGTYTVTLKDTNACTTTAIVNVVPTLTITATDNGIYCNGGATDVTVTVMGGQYPLSYTLDGGVPQTDSVLLNVGAGTHTIVVVDANSVVDSIIYTIAQPSAIAISYSYVSPICNGDSSGYAIAVATGGTPFNNASYSYVYDWYLNNILVINDSNAVNLGAGVYMLVVEDSLGCIDTIQNITLTEPTALNITASATGTTITVNTASGGVAPYLYSIDGTNFQAGTTFLNNNVGTYTVTLKDSNNCIATTVVSVIDVLTITATDNSIYCNGDTTQLLVSVAGGQAPYTYTLNNGTPQTDSVFTGLQAGTYTVYVSDFNSISDSLVYTITQPSAINIVTNGTAPLCNGDSSGSLIAVATGGTPFSNPYYAYVYDWYLNGNLIVNDSNAINLGAGTYMLVVEDSLGCIDTINNLTLTEPTALNLTANVNYNVITASASGGTAPYQYSIDGTNYQISDSFTVLTSGLYTVYAKDTNGCVTNVVVNVSLIVITVSNNPIFCFGDTVNVAVSAVGGQSPYTYSIDGGIPQTDSVLYGVAAGTHTIVVTDFNNSSDTLIYTLTQPTAINVNVAITNPLCFGLSTGSFTAQASGGTPYTTSTPYSYIYDWYYNNTLIVNDSFANNLPAGTYFLVVEDSTACVDTIFNLTITEPTLLTATANSFGGVTTVLASGGTPGYVYSLNGGANQTSNVFTGTTTGVYTITVTDTNGCTTTVLVNGSTISAVNTTLACFGDSSSIVVTVTGGTTPYQYSLDGVTYQSSDTLKALAGTYTITAQDANGYTATTVITITQPTLLVANAGINTPILCNGGMAVVNVSAVGGTPGYTGTGLQAPQSSGTYIYTVTDANGCTATSQFTITQPTLLAPSSTVSSPILCFGGTGVVSVLANGGTPPFTGVGNFTVSAGTYTYYVSDANGCADSTVITVTQPAPSLFATAALTSPIACNGGTAIVTVSATGGTSPYSNTGTFNPSAGTYTYVVSDANGCTAASTLTITQPTVLSASAVAGTILCNGGTTTVNVNATGGTAPYTGVGLQSSVSAGTYTYTVTDANGCTASTVISISQPSVLQANATLASAILCAGGNAVINVTASGGTPNYSGTGTYTVTAGTYTYTVTDAAGCTASSSIIITQPTALSASASISTAVACNGGLAAISVTAAGGTAPYSGTGSFSNGVGTYTYTVSDANGCTSSTTLTVTQPAPLTLNLSATNILCNGGTTTISSTVNGGTPVYTYNWSGASATLDSMILEPSLDNTIFQSNTSNSNGAGEYFVAGTTNTGSVRRGLIAFDVAGSLPSGATIVNATLKLNVSLVSGPSPISNTSLHLVSSQWGQGTSNAGTLAGQGTAATTGDATWLHRLFSTQLWTNPGGDFNASASATTAVGGVGAYTWSSAQLTADVANMYANPTNNFGWLIKTDEAVNNQAKRYNSSENLSTSTRPQLVVYYTSNSSSGNSLSNVGAGTYTLTVTDANGCSTTSSITVTQPTAVTATATVVNNVACFGGNAIVNVTASGGTGAFTGTGTYTVTAGTYSYTVADANGCSTTVSVTVTQPSAALQASATLVSPIACDGGTATVNVSATGGTAPYTGTGTYNPSAGTYTYTVTDANGCLSSTTLTITQPTLLTASASAGSILCNGGNGVITLTANGGTAPYTGVGPQAPVVAGTYTYTVTDANGCTATASATLTQPSAIAVTIFTVVPATCNGSNAILFVGATGGTGALSGTGIFTVGAGSYTYTVTDANGCTGTSAVTVTEPSGLNLTATQSSINCFGGTATITLTGSGGTSPYQYNLNGGSYQSSNTFSGLTANTYNLSVKDSNNCTFNLPYTVTQPAQLVGVGATVNPILCFGDSSNIAVNFGGGTVPYTYSIIGFPGTQSSNIFYLPVGTYTFEATDLNGCTAQYVVNQNTQPALMTASATATTIACTGDISYITVNVNNGASPYQYSLNGGAFQSSNVITTLAGSYTIGVQDANACFTSVVVTITEPAVLLNVTASADNILCNGGSATVTAIANGGLAPYSYTLTGISGSTTNSTGSFANTIAGSYTVSVSDSLGCIKTATLTITEPAALSATLSASNILCNGGTTTLTATTSGGTTPYLYSLNGGPTQSGNTFTVGAGSYTVNIVDSNACSYLDSITITQPAPLVVVVSANDSSLIAGQTLSLYINSPIAVGNTYNWSGPGGVNVNNDTATLTVTAANNGIYTATVTDANACVGTATLNITVVSAVQLAMKVFLSGPYVVASGLMQDSLRANNLIPTTEPYSTAPYNTFLIHTNGGGGETVSSPATVFANNGSNSIVDWVFVELRNGSDSSQIVATRAALLQRDGDVVDVDGTSPVLFANSLPGNYFVSVKHRNHLGIMTKTAQFLPGPAYNLDLTQVSAALHRRPLATVNNSTIIFTTTQDTCTRLLGTGINQRRALYGGNGNVVTTGNPRGHRMIRYNNINNDRLPLSSVAGLTGSTFGYLKEDYNMDAKARYNGVANDRLVLLQNIGSDANATVHEQTPN